MKDEMDLIKTTISVLTILLPIAYAMISLISLKSSLSIHKAWSLFTVSSVCLTCIAVVALVAQWAGASSTFNLFGISGLMVSPLQGWISLLVQTLGAVIGIFSSRYLQGEHNQKGYIAAFSGVLAAVHVLLLSNHWVVLITAWAVIGIILKQLLCYFPNRPFAVLAAHKKQIADRTADGLLIVAAGLAWWQVGSGSFTALSEHVSNHGSSTALSVSAVCLVLAAILRTALLPVHGWLIQVMEAPTPVSALLHAGVVNLSCFVLIKFDFLLNATPIAKWILVFFGFVTAFAAGLVMLTRVSVKLRLAWSTVAQMGFMILECGLGLYTLAVLHLIGHSIYKAHAFLSASTVVEQTKQHVLSGAKQASFLSMVLSPIVATFIVLAVQQTLAVTAWPWWWSVILGVAWSPMMWVSAQTKLAQFLSALYGAVCVLGLAGLVTFLHKLPFGIIDQPDLSTGEFALAGMVVLYFAMVAIQHLPHKLYALQRWSYAGFYLDEFYTKLTLRLWPVDWASSNR